MSTPPASSRGLVRAVAVPPRPNPPERGRATGAGRIRRLAARIAAAVRAAHSASVPF